MGKNGRLQRYSSPEASAVTFLVNVAAFTAQYAAFQQQGILIQRYAYVVQFKPGQQRLYENSVVAEIDVHGRKGHLFPPVVHQGSGIEHMPEYCRAVGKRKFFHMMYLAAGFSLSGREPGTIGNEPFNLNIETGKSSGEGRPGA